MSAFDNENKDELYENIEQYFRNGGSLGEFFEIIEYYFSDKELKE